MQHLSEYADAIRCIRNRRYTPAASFMVEGMVEKTAERISAEQKTNLTTTVARKLRHAHTRLLTAQSGGVALRAMAEQAYLEVQGEMSATLGGTVTAPPTI